MPSLNRKKLLTARLREMTGPWAGGRQFKIGRMAQSLKELIKCPHCGGSEIVYSCEPKCCFNHVCADCRSTFEINTQKTGRFDHQSGVQGEEPPSGEPTTGCANCESLRVAVLSTAGDETLLLCADCRAVLKLAIEEFVPGSF